MPIHLKNFQWVDFREYPINKPLSENVELFNICSPIFDHEPFRHEVYCRLLLEKVLTLSNMTLEKFFDYQLAMIQSPYYWLTSLEALVDRNNKELFHLGHSHRVDKLFHLIDNKRIRYPESFEIEISSSISTDVFIFENIKAHLLTLSTSKEKKIHLLRVKTDFLQSCYTVQKMNPGLDKHIDLELNYIKILEEINGGSQVHSKLIWNGQINQLVDIFFQCLQIEADDGSTLLESGTEQLVNFIINNFRKKDGSNFIASTIRTILRPARYDKRPKGHKKINVEKITKKSKEE